MANECRPLGANRNNCIPSMDDLQCHQRLKHNCKGYRSHLQGDSEENLGSSTGKINPYQEWHGLRSENCMKYNSPGEYYIPPQSSRYERRSSEGYYIPSRSQPSWRSQPNKSAI